MWGGGVGGGHVKTHKKKCGMALASQEEMLLRQCHRKKCCSVPVSLEEIQYCTSVT